MLVHDAGRGGVEHGELELMGNTAIAPVFSHGGSTEGPWTAVSGSVTGAGRPIDVSGSIGECGMSVYLAGTSVTATVTIECSSGQLDTTGNPPSASWIDVSPEGAGWVLDTDDPATTFLGKIIPATLAPYWRTKITAIDSGATVTSLIPHITAASNLGTPVIKRAQYPTITTYPNQTGV